MGDPLMLKPRIRVTWSAEERAGCVRLFQQSGQIAADFSCWLRKAEAPEPGEGELVDVPREALSSAAGRHALRGAKAGWRSAVLYTIIGTCAVLNVNPEAYLLWVLPQFAVGTNKTAANGLLPHDFAALFPEHVLPRRRHTRPLLAPGAACGAGRH